MNIFRRHTQRCVKGYGQYDRTKDKCSCPVWVEGKLPSGFIRISAGTRSLSRARRLVVEAEERGSWSPISEEQQEEQVPLGEPVSACIERFIDDAGSRRGKNLANPTVSKYRTILGRLEAYCVARHLLTLPEVTFAQLNDFKRTWETGPQSTANYIARLRSFWKYCVKNKWCQSNVAGDLDMPRNYQLTRRDPFTDEEMARIIEAARTVDLDIQQEVTHEELECFIRLMRCSGMAIADATLFQASELRGDEVRYFRKKTIRQANKQLVVVPIPEDLVVRLNRLPLHGRKYFFCHGSDYLISAVDVWHNRIRQVLDHAGLPHGTSHRFRHTFSCDLLTKGVSIELVSRWLGHSSIKITERHYSHFLEERIGRASQVLRDIYRND